MCIMLQGSYAAARKDFIVSLLGHMTILDS